MSTFAARLNEQIGNEFGASQQYVAVAVYYDSQSLPQLAAHFYRQAVEERNHAMIMVQYLLDADEDVVTPGVQAPQTAFSDAVAPVALPRIFIGRMSQAGQLVLGIALGGGHPTIES